MPKLNRSPLYQLRREAPGSLRLEDVANFMDEQGFAVKPQMVGDFERGKYMPADERFLDLYARAIRKSRKAVREAYDAAHDEYVERKASKLRRAASRR